MRDDKSFAKTLDSVQRQAPLKGGADPASRAFVDPMSNVAPPLGVQPPLESGAGSLWEHASAWIPPYDPPASSDLPAPGAEIDEVARELNLEPGAKSDDLNRARRRFM